MEVERNARTNCIACISRGTGFAPAERNMLLHLMWLREWLESGALEALDWSETRAISADVHTKSSILRECQILLAIEHSSNMSLAWSTFEVGETQCQKINRSAVV